MKKFLFGKDWVLPALAVVGFYLLLAAVGIGCPIKFVTGISCAGCGMTRAWLAFFHGDLVLALRYHAFFPLIPAAVVVYIFRDRFPKARSLDICLFSFAGVLFLYGVLRWLGVVIIP